MSRSTSRSMSRTDLNTLHLRNSTNVEDNKLPTHREEEEDNEKSDKINNDPEVPQTDQKDEKGR